MFYRACTCILAYDSNDCTAPQLPPSPPPPDTHPHSTGYTYLSGVLFLAIDLSWWVLFVIDLWIYELSRHAQDILMAAHSLYLSGDDTKSRHFICRLKGIPFVICVHTLV